MFFSWTSFQKKTRLSLKCVFELESVFVAQRHMVETPTVPPFHLPLTVCQSFLLKKAIIRSHTLVWSKHDKGKVSAAASGFMEVLMGTGDVTRCNFLSNRTEWSKQPPNWMSYCLFSVLSPASSLAFSSSSTSEKKSWQISPLRRFLRGYSLQRRALWQRPASSFWINNF